MTYQPESNKNCPWCGAPISERWVSFGGIRLCNSDCHNAYANSVYQPRRTNNEGCALQAILVTTFFGWIVYLIIKGMFFS